MIMILLISFIMHGTTPSEKKENLIKKPFKDNGITLKTDGSEEAENLKIPKEYYDLLNIVNNEEVDNGNIDNDLDNIEVKNEEPLYLYNGNNKERKKCIKNSSNFSKNILDYLNIINEDKGMDINEE